MSDNVRKLTVSLYLENDQFDKAIRQVNREIKLAESEFKLASAGTKDFEKTISGLDSKSDMLNKTLRGQKESIEVLTKKLSALNKAQEQQYLAYSKTSDEYREAKNDLLLYKKAVEETERALEQAKAAGDTQTVSGLEEKLKQQKKEYAEQEKYVSKLSSTVNKYTNQLGRTQGEITDTTTELKRQKAELIETQHEFDVSKQAIYKHGVVMEAWAEKAQNATKAFEGIGGTLTKTITTPIVSAGVAAAKAGIDYEDAFVAVKKTVDATGEDADAFFEGLSDSVLDMSKRLATSADDIAEVMSIAGQLGIENDQLESFTETIVRLGMSTNMAGEEAASAMAKFANITGMEQSEFANMGSTLVDLGNHFATTESDIMDMASRIAAAGAQVGMTEPEILGFAAVLSSLGLAADAGGSAFSKALKKMEVAVATDNEQLADFAKVAGMSEEAFKTLWKNDPSEAFEAFIVGLSKIDEEGIGAIATLEEIGFTELRLSDTMLRTANATELLHDAQTMANESWAEGTALINESDTKLQTTASRLTNVKNSLVAVGIQFADTLAPFTETLVSKLEGAVEWIGNLDESTRQNIVRWGAYAAAVGPAVKILGKFGTGITNVTGSVGKFMQAMAKVNALVSEGKTVTQALATMISPGSAMMLGLTAAAAGIAALYVQYKRLEDAKPDFSLDTSDIEKYAIDAEQIEAEITVDTSVNFAGDIETLHDQLIDTLTDGVRETDQDREEMTEAISGVVNGIYEELENAIAAKRGDIEESYALGLIDEDAYNQSLSALTAQGDALKTDLSEKGDAIAAYVTALSESNRKLTGDEITTLNELLDALGTTAEKVSEVTAVKQDAYKFAYEKTRLGLGSETDQRMALEYIELLANRKIEEIEAEKTALEKTAAEATADMNDQQKTQAVEALNEQLAALDEQMKSIDALKVQGFGEVLSGVLDDADIDAEKLARYMELMQKLSNRGFDLSDGLSFMESTTAGWLDLFSNDPLPDWINEIDAIIQEMDDSGLFSEDSPLKTMLATLAEQGLIPADSLDTTYGLVTALAQLNAQVQPTLDAVSALESETAAEAANILPGITSAINDGKSDAVGAMEDVAKEIADVLPTELDMHSPSRKLYNQGYNVMLGFRNGILAGRAGVISAMREAARAAVNAAKEELQIHSPSQVFEDEVGVMTMKGFGRGITKETKKQAAAIRNAAKYLTQEAQGGTMNDNRRTYNSESNVTVTGNTFVVNDKQDVQTLAIELASLTRQNQRGRGLRMA